MFLRGGGVEDDIYIILYRQEVIMDKFWIVVTAVFIIGVVMILMPVSGSNMDVRDLETECQYRAEPSHSVSTQKGQLRFQGNFHVNNIEQEPGISYNVEGNRINVEIDVTEAQEPETFYNNCLASVVYDFGVEKPDAGNYILSIVHDGELVEESIVTLR